MIYKSFNFIFYCIDDIIRMFKHFYIHLDPPKNIFIYTLCNIIITSRGFKRNLLDHFIGKRHNQTPNATTVYDDPFYNNVFPRSTDKHDDNTVTTYRAGMCAKDY